MFETAEVGHQISREDFNKAETELRGRLLEAQRKLRETKSSLIVIVSGVEAAGKSEVVNRLNEWLDTRGVQSVAFWDESDEERERPRLWRFWRKMPPRGSIGIFFGSWYTQPIVDLAFDNIDEASFGLELNRIVELERTIHLDKVVIIKLWFHLSKKAQKRRLQKIAESEERKLTPWEKSFSKLYNRFSEISESAVRNTDTGHAPWHVIDAEDKNYRDLSAGRLLLQGLESALSEPPKPTQQPLIEAGSFASLGAERTVLDSVDLSASVTDEEYDRQLSKAHSRVNALAWKAREQKRSVVTVFEGWDAAGKGGAIRRVTSALDARLYRVIPVAAPTDEERAQHYLWRFWRHLPRAGYFTIYDRSWYGRVLVERVEGFAKPEEWMRAYSEINSFEEQLTQSGIIVLKFWLHISPEEQLRRFQEREQIAHKAHKITAEDWRNREKWRPYEMAIDEMVARCSTKFAPWTLVPANDKRFARVMVLKTMADRLEAALSSKKR